MNFNIETAIQGTRSFSVSSLVYTSMIGMLIIAVVGVGIWFIVKTTNSSSTPNVSSTNTNAKPSTTTSTAKEPDLLKNSSDSTNPTTTPTTTTTPTIPTTTTPTTTTTTPTTTTTLMTTTTPEMSPPLLNTPPIAIEMSVPANVNLNGSNTQVKHSTTQQIQDTQSEANVISVAYSNATDSRKTLSCPTGKIITALPEFSYGNGSCSKDYRGLMEPRIIGQNKVTIPAPFSDFVGEKPCEDPHTVKVSYQCGTNLPTTWSGSFQASQTDSIRTIQCPVGQVVQQVKSASYGVDSCQMDVKDNLLPKLIGQSQYTLKPVLSNEFSTDPCPQRSKSFKMDYTCAVPSSPTSPILAAANQWVRVIKNWF